MYKEKNIFPAIAKYKTATNETQLKKSIIFIFFVVLQFIFGVNLGFCRRKSTKAIIVNLLSLIPLICIIISALYVFVTNSSNPLAFSWIFNIVIQHLFTILPLHFCASENTLFSGRRNLQYVSKQLHMRVSFWDTDIALIFFSIFLLIVMFLLSFIFCTIVPTECFYSGFIHTVLLMSVFGLHIPLVVYSFFFFFVYRHLVKIKTYILKNNACDLNFAQKMYKRLNDLIETIRRAFDRLVSINILNPPIYNILTTGSYISWVLERVFNIEL